METANRPLEGVKIIELANFIAAPSCARYLADLGADVIKVEAPSRDPLRGTAINEGRPLGDYENTSFDLDNANKRCICLNTKAPEGLEALLKLIAAADIFITNVREKSLQKQGLDYESLKAKFPKLVYGYVTGYGEKGPDKDLPGFDFTAFFARGGMLGTLFDKDHVPMIPVPGVGDHQVAMNLASGIIAALYRASRTGTGDKVTVSLFHSAIWDMGIMLQAAQYGDKSTQYPISRKSMANPFNMAHKTRDGRWIQFSAPAYDRMYDRFVTALDRADLAGDPRFFPQANLQNNLEEFYNIIVEAAGKKDLAPIAAGIDQNEEFPMDVVKQMGDLGFLGLKIPEEFGGLGLDMRSYVCVMEEIVKKCAAATLFISSANSLSTAPIVISGTPEQKERYLPGVVAGEEFIAFGLTEPNAGSDAASLTTKAVADGDGYILNGRKCFITMAPIANSCIVYAKTSPEKGAKGISCFLVDMSLPGVSCGKHEEKMGQRGVPVSDVVLEDVRVPKSCMIGEPDLGFINAMKTLSVGRIGAASMCLGMAAEAIELAVEHTKNRVQFGKPLCKHQAIAFMLADMETKLNAARGLVYNAAWLMDNGVKADKEASMAKYFAAESAIDIINKSLQLHGGYGYSREYEIERLYRDVRVCSIYEGSSQVQQIVISGQMLK